MTSPKALCDNMVLTDIQEMEATADIVFHTPIPTSTGFKHWTSIPRRERVLQS